MNLGIRRPAVFLNFPSAGILDTFNRANTGPPPSASWTNAVEGAGTGLKVVSNQLITDSGGSSGWWNVGTFGPDSECYFDVVTLSGSMNLYLRLQQPGSGSTVDGYLGYFDGVSLYKIFRMDNGSLTQLGASVTDTLASGNSIGMQAIGPMIRMFKKVSGAWSVVIERSDGTYAAAGYIGLGINSALSTYDNFGGGSSV